MEQGVSRVVDEVLRAAEKIRRRRRTETGRSPAQQTVRSRNDYRAAKRPGKRERRQLRQELHRQGSW